MAEEKKLLIFANHNNGCNIVNYLHNRSDAKIVKLVVLDDERNQWWKSVKKLAKTKKIPFIIFKTNEDLYKIIKKLDIDLLLSISWRFKIPKKILDIPKLGCVNFHNSLLPKHRGVYANAWPILLGEAKTGVTLHWMTENLDDGDIIAQKEFEINSWDTAKDVWKKLNVAYLKLFKEMWSKVNLWKTKSKPQGKRSSYHCLKDFLDSDKIDLNKKVKIKDFINFLRSKSFEPYYKNVYFIDPKSKKKIYISINLEVEKN